MDAQVVIAGAGPAGALLAYLLSSRGIETILIERHHDFSREFRGEVLMPSGIRALAEAGFSIDEVATSAVRTVEAYQNGRRFLSLDAAFFGENPPTAVSQPELLESLARRAEATGAFDLRRGTTLRNVTREPDGSLSLHLKTRESDREEVLRAPFLIGADGRSSVVRRRLRPPVRARSNPLDVVWFKMPYPESWEDARFRFELGRGHLLIALRAPDGLLQLAWVILKGAYGELRSRGIEDWAEEMSRHADPELADHITRHRERLTDPFLLDVITDRVLGWASPGALLIGDAAHTMSPVGAQGINLALRDAIVAANELVPALRATAGVDAAAARVEDLRGPEIDRIQRIAAFPPRVVMGRTPIHEATRRAIAFLASRVRPGERARSGASLFLDGATEVELRV